MHDCSMRVDHSFLGMCVVDAWMLSYGSGGATADLTQREFYGDLAAEVIDYCSD